MDAFGPDQAGDKRINLIAPGESLAGNSRNEQQLRD
jgi:hypothetical protein